MINQAEDQDFRDEIKKSMSQPFKPLNRVNRPIVLRPFYSSKSENHACHRPGHNRRARGILSIRRFWWDHNEEIGMLLWMIAFTMMAAGTIWVYGVIGR